MSADPVALPVLWSLFSSGSAAACRFLFWVPKTGAISELAACSEPKTPLLPAQLTTPTFLPAQLTTPLRGGPMGHVLQARALQSTVGLKYVANTKHP